MKYTCPICNEEISKRCQEENSYAFSCENSNHPEFLVYDEKIFCFKWDENDKSFFYLNSINIDQVKFTSPDENFSFEFPENLSSMGNIKELYDFCNKVADKHKIFI